MFKKIFLIIIILVIVLLIGYIIYWLIFRTCCGQTSLPVEAGSTKEERLADPNLLYASSSWAGLCSNDKQERGGCYTDIYLYSNGNLVRDSGFVPYDGERQANPVSELEVESAMMSKILEKINNSRIMEKDCPPNLIMDAGWDYEINLDGVKKSFHNPPDDCQEIFFYIDNIISSVSY
jgi:hypothetical protein